MQLESITDLFRLKGLSWNGLLILQKYPLRVIWGILMENTPIPLLIALAIPMPVPEFFIQSGNIRKMVNGGLCGIKTQLFDAKCFLNII